MFILKKETTGCTSLAILNSGVTGPKFTNFTNNVARSSQMKFLKNQNCDITIPFGMSGLRIKPDFAMTLKIGCHGNVPLAIGKRGQIRNLRSNTYHMVRTLCSKVYFKKILRQSEHYIPHGRHAARAYLELY